ncbi:hypothetical protein DL767_009991 [Monosporascus sp. MG133]|nr:hypothetical protein DL767_009991 [Monosporascus sp. MG133]
MASFMYKYKPLDLATDTIRLVCLLKGSFNDDIRCELWESRLHRDDVPYEALSYTWGGTEKSARIFLCGCIAQVTHNLYTALRYLRLERQDRILWIDAICIDQDNERERGHQVGQMRRIYQNAEKVLIWLGPGTNETDFLMDSISQYFGKNLEGSMQRQVPSSVKDFKSFYEDPGFEEFGSYKKLLAREQRLSSVAGSLFRLEYREIDANMEYHEIGAPLSFLAEKGRHEVVETILARNDANINLGSPLAKAAENGHERVVTLLLARNEADINLDLPLAKAAEMGHDAIVRLLLARNDVDVNLGSPLAFAARNGHERVVRLLLENGADKESRDIRGRTPLSWAAGKGHERAIRLLLENGASKESRDGNGRTPLSWAAGSGREWILRLLLETGADKESRNIMGRTPLSWAAGEGHERAIRLLLENGADKESRDIKGRTSLSWAAGGGHFNVVELLLENGAEKESRDSFGRTPLSWAAGNCCNYTAELLLCRGAAVESRDNDGRTPLSWAETKMAEAKPADWDVSSLRIIKLLHDRGVKSDSKNEENHKAEW